MTRNEMSGKLWHSWPEVAEQFDVATKGKDISADGGGCNYCFGGTPLGESTIKQDGRVILAFDSCGERCAQPTTKGKR